MRLLKALLLIAFLPLSTAHAQDAEQAQSLTTVEALREALVGSYSGSEHRLHIAEVASPPFERPLYVELARHGFEVQPDRQQLWWFYERDGEVRVRVNEFPPRVMELFATNIADLAVGAWGAPQFFPQIRSDQYDAVGDLLVTVQDGQITLTNEHAFPISFGGAIESEVHITISDDSLAWMEVGRDSDGQIVWPASDKLKPIEMDRLSETPSAVRLESGVVILDLREGLSADVEGMDQIDLGDNVAVHYTGWLATGMLIDSSHLPDRSIFIGKVPTPGGLLGFTDALLGMRGANYAGMLPPFSNTVRRAYIPASRAYGAQGSPPMIPPNSSLIFNFELQSIRPEALEHTNDQPPRGPDGR